MMDTNGVLVFYLIGRISSCLRDVRKNFYKYYRIEWLLLCPGKEIIIGLERLITNPRKNMKIRRCV